MARNGAWLHHPDHQVRFTPAEEKLWAKVQPLLDEIAFHPPRVRDLSRSLLIDEDAMREFLKRAARLGRVYPVAHDHYFTQAAVADLAEIVRALAAESGAVNAAVFRDRIGTGRKLAIQILEFFDRIGFTRRAKDSHVPRRVALFERESGAAREHAGADDCRRQREFGVAMSSPMRDHNCSRARHQAHRSDPLVSQESAEVRSLPFL